MDKDTLRRVLADILERIGKEACHWRLDGSSNLLVQGVEVSVNDLDITTDDEGIIVFRKVLREFVIKDEFSEKIAGHTLVCMVSGVEVEINAYGDRKKSGRDGEERVFMAWEGLEVPILPLEQAKEFYAAIGRSEKVALIQKHLSGS